MNCACECMFCFLSGIFFGHSSFVLEIILHVVVTINTVLLTNIDVKLQTLIYTNQLKQQTAKPRGSKSNTAQYGGLSKQQCIKLLRATPEIFCSLLCEFYHSTNPFSPCFLLLFFCLVAFFILHAIRLNLFFSAFHY